MRHQGIYAVYLRELALYFYSPLAYIFMGAFLALSTGISFYGLDFYQRQQADLLPFFNLHPWLYTILVPALGMRLWAEEKASQSLKLILSLNLKNHELILGKFLAAWSLIGLTLIFSCPMWISLAYLGEPDHQVIFSSYLGSWLLAGIYLSMAQALSLLARHQINAWLLALITGLLISLLSLEHLLDFILPWV
ncbi:ABC-2 type transport system permease protein [Allopseudospirillum japonicum]|uniref:ABC-2 type transport system permease protein n=1 Tax=Allopseudospirillum japonicum TaxID=64971 RepID=A0A1H6SUY1_9GAMM|nr:ABC transporter permease subunit [Allopseudospirillum japonicum]SEI67830.1 ABC-2 type transport system permease protein [Allopseudospirillum japonicum]